MDWPQKPLLTLLTVLAAIAGIIGCFFGAPSFILSLRQLMADVTTSGIATQQAVALTATPLVTRPIPPASPTSTRITTPSPTATRAVSNVWRQGNIRVETGLTSVSGANLRLSVKITNEGNSDFTARFRSEDWTLVDDTGKTYASDNNAGLQTIPIRANASTTLNLFFRGTLAANTRKLTLQLPDLSGMADVGMSLPVGSDVSSLRYAAGLVSSSGSSVRLFFRITNEGSSDFIARFRMEDFTLVDDSGRSYASDNNPQYQVIQINSNANSTITLFFKGALNPSAKKVTLQLAQLSGAPNIAVEVPVNSQ